MSYLQLSISDRDEESSLLPRWAIGLTDHRHPHHPSICHLSLEWSTRIDGKWGSRSALRREIRIPMPAIDIQSLIESLQAIPALFPDECLGHDDVHTHGGCSPTRANKDRIICRSISTSSESGWGGAIYIRTNSHIWTDSQPGLAIIQIVQAHLITLPRNPKISPSSLP